MAQQQRPPPGPARTATSAAPIILIDSDSDGEPIDLTNETDAPARDSFTDVYYGGSVGRSAGAGAGGEREGAGVGESVGAGVDVGLGGQRGLAWGDVRMGGAERRRRRRVAASVLTRALAALDASMGLGLQKRRDRYEHCAVSTTRALRKHTQLEDFTDACVGVLLRQQRYISEVGCDVRYCLVQCCRVLSCHRRGSLALQHPTQRAAARQAPLPTPRTSTANARTRQHKIIAPTGSRPAAECGIKPKPTIPATARVSHTYGRFNTRALTRASLGASSAQGGGVWGLDEDGDGDGAVFTPSGLGRHDVRSYGGENVTAADLEQWQQGSAAGWVPARDAGAATYATAAPPAQPRAVPLPRAPPPRAAAPAAARAPWQPAAPAHAAAIGLRAGASAGPAQGQQQHVAAPAAAPAASASATAGGHSSMTHVGGGGHSLVGGALTHEDEEMEDAMVPLPPVSPENEWEDI